MKPEGSLPNSQAPASIRTLKHSSPVYAFPSHFLDIYFNIILLSMFRYYK
jgi:hypothetical protein